MNAPGEGPRKDWIPFLLRSFWVSVSQWVATALGTAYQLILLGLYFQHDPVSYGELGALLSILSLAFFPLGLLAGNLTRHVSLYRGRGSPEAANALARYAIRWGIALTGTFAMGLGVTSYW